ncbi:MAG: sugar ABC transporter substrate-binding protein, partial [Candidatus Margulisbacteria bacterium]|nr:sugar ABC transporter substrate-binding protein [Candidatus Margulisiibacteriota bacterium]
MKKILAIIMLFLLIFTVGCSKKEQNQGIVTLNIWMMPNSQEPENDLNAVLEPFLKANPNIKVKISSLDWGAAWSKLTTAASSSTDVPDIVQIGTTWLGAIASMGALEDLTERFQKDALADKYVPLSLSNVGPAGSGRISSLPWIIDIRAMFYRTDVLSRLGLQPKDLSTWEGLDKSLAKIKEAKLVINGKKVSPLGITGKNDWNIIHNVAPWIWMNGGSFIDKDFKNSNIASKAAVEGLYFYIDFVRKGYVPITCLEQNSAQISSGFNNGLYAVYFDGPYALRTLTLPPERGGSSNLPVAKNFGISVYPASPQGKIFTYGGGSNLAMFKVGKHKEEAWKLIKYLSLNKEAQLAYSKLSGFIPVAKNALHSPYFTDDPYRKVFVESVKYGRNYPAIERWARMETGVFPPRFGYIWNKVVQDPEGFTKEELEKELLQNQYEINKLIQSEGMLSALGNFPLIITIIISIFFISILIFVFRTKKKFGGMKDFWERKAKDFKHYKVAYFFIAPAALGMLLMHLIPILQGIYMAFLNLNQFTF